MNYWFIAYIIISALGLGVELSKDGEQKQGKHSFFGSLIGTGVSLFIIYKAI